MLSLYTLTILPDKQALSDLPKGKLLINTINAHSYNVAQQDALFAEALAKGDVLTADGASIVQACRYLHTPSQPTERVAGWDVFIHEMTALEKQAEASNTHPVAFFMGSSPGVLQRIKERAALDFPYLKIVTYSPPFNDCSQTGEVDIFSLARSEYTLPRRHHWRGVRLLRRHSQTCTAMVATPLLGVALSPADRTASHVAPLYHWQCTVHP